MNPRPSLWIPPLLLLACFIFPQLLLAETATLEIYYLPLHEAEAVVKSQLSKTGSVAILSSRRILVINDDPQHIEQAKKLLKRVDQPVQQYTLYLEFFSIKENQAQSITTSAHLPGGWARITVEDNRQHISTKKRFNLHLTSNNQSSIESGSIVPYRQQTKQWLAGYGVIRANSVEMIPITSGFFANVRSATSDQVHIHIEPWMRSQHTNTEIRGETEILFGLGATHAPQRPPSNQAPIRLNAKPSSNQHINQAIEIAGAATELTIPLGETVTIMAYDKEAEMLGKAMLSSSSNVDSNRFVITLRVEER
ncbi:MAG: type II and III secretion system family protein [Mariprofundaceae bacterium]